MVHIPRMDCPYCHYREEDIIFINHKVIDVRDKTYIIACFRCASIWQVYRSEHGRQLNVGEDYPKCFEDEWWPI